MLKGIKVLGVITIAALALSGCGKKEEKLVCVYKSEGVESKEIYEYTGDIINKAISEETMNYDGELFTAEEIEAGFEELFKEYGDEKGIEMNHKNNEAEKTFKMSMTIDFKVVDMELLADLGIVEKDMNGNIPEKLSLKVTKENLENLGYDCK